MKTKGSIFFSRYKRYFLEASNVAKQAQGVQILLLERFCNIF